jgi:hypothetical protein
MGGTAFGASCPLALVPGKVLFSELTPVARPSARETRHQFNQFCCVHDLRPSKSPEGELDGGEGRLPVRFSKSMEAYHIDRFGGVDGIVLRSSADPRPGPKEILMRVRANSLNYHELDGPQGRRSRSCKARRRAVERRRWRRCDRRRRVTSGQSWRSDRRHDSSAPVGLPGHRGLSDRPARRQS